MSDPEDAERLELLQDIKANTGATVAAVEAIAPDVAGAATAADIVRATAETVAASMITKAAETAEGVTAEAKRRAIDVAAAAEASGRRAADGLIGGTTKTVSSVVQRVVTPEGKVVAAPTTTEEDDRVSAGQRQINLVWESTQRQLALLVIGSAVAVAAYLAIMGDTDAKTGAAVFIYGAANLIAGFYFGRTNHTKTGGPQGSGR